MAKPKNLEQRANREKSELLAAVHPARHGGESAA